MLIEGRGAMPVAVGVKFGDFEVVYFVRSFSAKIGSFSSTLSCCTITFAQKEEKKEEEKEVQKLLKRIVCENNPYNWL